MRVIKGNTVSVAGVIIKVELDTHSRTATLVLEGDVVGGPQAIAVKCAVAFMRRRTLRLFPSFTIRDPYQNTEIHIPPKHAGPRAEQYEQWSGV